MSGTGSGHDLQREDEPIPELEAWQRLAAASAVFMRGLLTFTNKYPAAAEKLRASLDELVPGWRDVDR